MKIRLLIQTEGNEPDNVKKVMAFKVFRETLVKVSNKLESFSDLKSIELDNGYGIVWEKSIA